MSRRASSAPSSSTRSRLVSATTPSRDAEQLHDRGVLARLRHDAVVGGHDEQEEVDPGGAGDHRPDEALVAGDVDHRQRAPRRQLERRIAELDRDPARLLLGQPVGVDAGERRHQGGLAVVDVARRAERQRVIRRHSSSVSVRQSSRTRPSWTRATTGGSPPRSAAARPSPPSSAQAKLSSSSSGTAPPPTRARVAHDRAAEPLGEGRRALAHRARRLRHGTQHRDLAQGARAGRGRARASPRARPATACRSGPPARTGGGGCARPRRPCRR